MVRAHWEEKQRGPVISPQACFGVPIRSLCLTRGQGVWVSQQSWGSHNVNPRLPWKMVSVVRMKLPTPGHGYFTGELGNVSRDVGWDSLDPWEAATVTCVKRHWVESCQFPVSCGTQLKALNFPGDWKIWREEWLAQFPHKMIANLSKLYKNSA